MIALAALLGAILGFEREIKEKAAGIRTHLLVSTAAAAIVVLGRILNEQAVADGQTAGDPTRALHAVDHRHRVPVRRGDHHARIRIASRRG